MRGLHLITLGLLNTRTQAYFLAVPWKRLEAGHRPRGAPYAPRHQLNWPRRPTRAIYGEDRSEADSRSPGNPEGVPSSESTEEILYEECSRYADKTTVAQDVIFEIASVAHFQDVVSRATGADSAAPDGYLDPKGRWRHPHKLMLVEVYADWCRACKGLQPKLLKYIKKHPEVLCCKINKTKNEELAAKLGVRGLPMLILYKRGKRIDHMTTANINTIDEAITDSL